MSSNSPVEVVEAPSLKTKVRKVSRDEYQSMMSKAQTSIDTVGEDYEDWARKDLARLQLAAQVARSDTADRGRHLQAIFRISHDMKGQGGSFGYPLVTDITRILCRFIDNADESMPATLDVVDAHVQALTLVIRSGMSGDGGTMGDQLITGLTDAAAKVAG